jgi:hypothetical protein
MEMTTRPPITPPAIAIVVWALIPLLDTFWAPFVKPGAPLADSICPAPAISDVDVLSTSDCLAGATMSLVCEVGLKSSFVIWRDEVFVGLNEGAVEDETELSFMGGERVDVGVKGALDSIALDKEVVPGITLCEDMELVVLGKAPWLLGDGSGAGASTAVSIGVMDVDVATGSSGDEVDMVDVGVKIEDSVVVLIAWVPLTLLIFGTAVHLFPLIVVIVDIFM